MENLESVWKEFGKHSEAGKLLYELYGVKYQPKINYPKLKVKTKEEKEREKIGQEEEKSKNRAKSSNRIMTIQYPDLNKKKVTHIPKVDLIPKRKHENAIKKELDIIKKTIEPPKATITNRKAQIENLQQKFQFSANTNLPKGARLPAVKEVEFSSNNEREAKRSLKKDRKSELQHLYDCIMREIDERYQHIEALKSLGKRDSETAILAEIKDRLDELRKIEKMIKEHGQ